MTERMIREAHWGYIPLTLKAGEAAEKGKLACIDTASNGQIVKGKSGTGLIPIGIFTESMTGDGARKISIKLFHEIQAVWWNNDTTAPVTTAEIGLIVAIKDDQTVSADDTGRSVAGLCLAVDAAKGVLVYTSYPFAA